MTEIKKAEHQIRYAIGCAWQTCQNSLWRSWARRWIECTNQNLGDLQAVQRSFRDPVVKEEDFAADWALLAARSLLDKAEWQIEDAMTNAEIIAKEKSSANFTALAIWAVSKEGMEKMPGYERD
jgi:hypothetical protein